MAYAAGVLRRRPFPLLAESAWPRLGETWVNAHPLFLIFYRHPYYSI